MRKVLLVLAVFLAGCAVKAQAPDPRIADYLQWERDSVGKVQNGTMKRIDFYTEGFKRVAPLPSEPERNARMMFFNDMIPIARRFEAGELNQDQFDDLRRSNYMKSQAEKDRQIAALRAAYQSQQAAQQAQQAQDSNDILGTMMLLQGAQPRPIAPIQPINNTRCATRNVNGTLYTDCY